MAAQSLAILGTSLRDDAQQLAAAFRSASPFPHVVIDGFLDPELCARLAAEFPPFERGDDHDEMGRHGGKATCEDVRALGPGFRELDELLAAPAFLALLSSVTGIDDLLHDPDYLGGGTHENRPGQELDPHVDFNLHPRTGAHRRLNLILYLNEDWDESWGGNLELHADPWEPARDRVEVVVPAWNRAVLFATGEHSWHGFSEIRPPAGAAITRRSFAVYYYTAQAPEPEHVPGADGAPRTAVRTHSTVYVERDAPATFRAGAPLTLDDVRAVIKLFERHLEHRRRLLDREETFAERIRELLETTAAEIGEPLSAVHADAARWLLARHQELLRLLYEREPGFRAWIDVLERLPARRGGGRAPSSEAPSPRA